MIYSSCCLMQTAKILPSSQHSSATPVGCHYTRQPRALSRTLIRAPSWLVAHATQYLAAEMRIFKKSHPAHDWADPNWLAWPTLSCGGGGQIKTAGVSYHERALRAMVARTGRLVMAELRIERRGRYEGAVRIHVRGTELGSIPHGLAADFRKVVQKLNEADKRATCRAELDAEPGEHVDVWLSAKPELRSEDEPFLPPVNGARVTLASGESERLNEALGTRAKSKRVVGIGELVPRENSWALLVDERELGTLPCGSYRRLAETLAAGYPLSCRTRIIRAPGRPLRVEADFPTR
jgi:hypothetical protein